MLGITYQNKNKTITYENKNKLITYKVRQWMMGSLAGAATSYKITEVYKGELIYNFLY